MRRPPELAEIRDEFPALADGTAYFENAGGSQAPRVVADAIHRHLLTNYVNPGAAYARSQAASAVVRGAHAFINLFMNGAERGHVILGPSTSVLCRSIADGYAQRLAPDDEILVAQNGHEANIGPWARLERFGLKVRFWPVRASECTCSTDDLEALLGPRTRLVAFPHVSNILGEIVDVRAITTICHRAGARVLVDGVAYAPHGAIDVAAWGVDWYAYSTYKVFGPHAAALWGSTEAMAELPSANHFFIEGTPGRFELGGIGHEDCAGLLALSEYLNFLAGAPRDAEVTRATIVAAYERMADLEHPLVERLLAFLRAQPRVRIIGPTDAGPTRAGIISFVCEGRSSRELALAANQAGIGVKHGHMSAYRLVEALGLDPADGVVRVSFCHYNTLDEVERLIAVLAPLL